LEADVILVATKPGTPAAIPRNVAFITEIAVDHLFFTLQHGMHAFRAADQKWHPDCKGYMIHPGDTAVRSAFAALCAGLLVTFFSIPALSQDAKPADPPDPAKTPAMKADVDKVVADINAGALTGTHKQADIAWLLVACAFVMFMMPGLALFYGGMARRKNLLGTMMHTMIALGLVGVQWVCFGYSLSFGKPLVEIPEIAGASKGGFVGYSPELLCLGAGAATPASIDDIYKEMKVDPEKATDAQKTEAADKLAQKNRFNNFPNTNLPLYLHAMFQGMFAIITVALISGAFAERVKFSSFCLFAVIWTTVVYDPLAHMVWSFSWDPTPANKFKVPIAGTEIFPAAGYLGANGAIDFAGGTVVHIAAGASGLAACLLLRKRIGYGKQAFHPSSMVLTLLGAGMLWFGWFGFNGGSALYANGQAVSAFTVTQVAAAMAGLTWTVVEWVHRGKPTALGFASGLVAGLVAITPASGYVTPGGALVIGLIAGALCYGAVLLKGILGYDDSLDAFGIHGVGGFLGAILTGVFVNIALWSYGAEMPLGAFPGKTIVDEKAKTVVFDMATQIKWQAIAAIGAALYAFVVTAILVIVIDKTIGFTLAPKDEADGLDQACHGEAGFDYGVSSMDEATNLTVTPKSAAAPPMGGKRFKVIVEGIEAKTLLAAWSKLCQASDQPASSAFKAVYPNFSTVSGNAFTFRSGDPVAMKTALTMLLEQAVPGSKVSAHVES
jgi:ammonium transporter